MTKLRIKEYMLFFRNIDIVWKMND